MTKKTPAKGRPAAKSMKSQRQPLKAGVKPKAQALRTNATKNSAAKVENRKKPHTDKHARPAKHVAPALQKPAKPAKSPAALSVAEAKPVAPIAAKPEAVSATTPIGKPALPPETKLKAAAKPDPKAALKKNGAAAPETPPAPVQRPAKDDPDAPLLDMSDAAVRKMVTRAKQRGYVTYDELNRVLPSDKVSSEQIEDTMAMLNEMGINVIESEEQEEAEGEQLPATATGTADRRSPGKAGRDLRPHRRSRAHVFARDGIGRVVVARRRNRHRQAHRSRT